MTPDNKRKIIIKKNNYVESSESIKTNLELKKNSTQKRLSEFHFYLDSILSSFENIAILNVQGKCLKVKTGKPQLSVGLMQSPNLVKNFFKLNPSEILIHNEPSLGCTSFEEIYFIFNTGNFTFCISEEFDFKWTISATRDQEIIRIPPFPIYEKNQINSFLMESLKNNPLCSSEITDKIYKTVTKILKFIESVNMITQSYTFLTEVTVQENYLKECKEEAFFKIKQKEFLQSSSEVSLKNKEVLKVKIISDELGLKIDFQGSQTSKNILLPDLLTDSLCFDFISHLYQFSHKMNSATFSLLQITKPLNSLVSSKGQPPLLISEKLGKAVILNALHLTTWKMYPKLTQLPQNYYSAKLQLYNKSKNKYLKLDIPTGKTLYSIDPLNHERINFLNHSDGSSIPDIIDFYNIGTEVTILKDKPFTSGKNNNSSSKGWLFKLNTQDHLEVIFITDYGLENSSKEKKLQYSDISYIEVNNQKILDSFGVIELKPGDELTIHSGSSPELL